MTKELPKETLPIHLNFDELPGDYSKALTLGFILDELKVREAREIEPRLKLAAKVNDNTWRKYLEGEKGSFNPRDPRVWVKLEAMAKVLGIETEKLITPVKVQAVAA